MSLPPGCLPSGQSLSPSPELQSIVFKLIIWLAQKLPHDRFMGGLKSIVPVVVCVVASVAPVKADQSMLAVVAGCAGRLSAQLEHEWLMRVPDASNTETLRDAMAELLELMTQPESKARVMQVRLEAKYSQARLLSRSTFNADMQDRIRAERHAQTAVASRRELFLS